MEWLQLYLYWHPSKASLDMDAVVKKLRADFPTLNVLPGDKWLEEIHRLEDLNASAVVLDNLRRRWKREGPRLAFEILQDGLPSIQGHLNRYVIVFHFDEVSASSRERILSFLKFFGVGKIQTSQTGQKGIETLLDMTGVPDCVAPNLVVFADATSRVIQTDTP